MRKTDEQRGDWKEWRRRRAWQLSQQGWSQKKIAEALGVTEGSCEPMDEARTRARGRRITRKHCRGASTTPLCRAVGATSRTARSRSAGPWVSWRGLDHGTSGRAHQEAVWVELSSGTYESAAQADQVQRTTADRAGHATG